MIKIMGICQSYSVLTEQEVFIYQNVTGFSKAEIQYAFKRFYNVDPLAFYEHRLGRVPINTVADTIEELQANPLRYRVCQVFCSSRSGFMDFDDFLELVFVMSNHASLVQKLSWAFQLYDFNNDNAICPKDIVALLTLVSGGTMSQESMDKVADQVFNEADLDGDRLLSFQEFERIMTLHSAPEFLENFRFVL